MTAGRTTIGSLGLTAGLVLAPVAVRAAEADTGMRERSPIVTWIVDLVTPVVEAAGIGVIIIGAVAVTWLFLRGLARGEDRGQAYQLYRSRLGRAILLGLEFLVAADIIGTVAVAPTFSSLGVLGLLVLIRSFLSTTLEMEINGRWPWQGEGAVRKGPQRPDPGA